NNQNPRQNIKIMEMKELYSKKIDKKLLRPQVTNIQQDTKVLKIKVYNIKVSPERELTTKLKE
ncbi:35895_t:CDS:1, partial [Gigaspora margarita]